MEDDEFGIDEIVRSINLKKPRKPGDPEGPPPKAPPLRRPGEPAGPPPIPARAPVRPFSGPPSGRAAPAKAPAPPPTPPPPVEGEWEEEAAPPATRGAPVDRPLTAGARGTDAAGGVEDYIGDLEADLRDKISDLATEQERARELEREIARLKAEGAGTPRGGGPGAARLAGAEVDLELRTRDLEQERARANALEGQVIALERERDALRDAGGGDERLRRLSMELEHRTAALEDERRARDTLAVEVRSLREEQERREPGGGAVPEDPRLPQLLSELERRDSDLEVAQAARNRLDADHQKLLALVEEDRRVQAESAERTAQDHAAQLAARVAERDAALAKLQALEAEAAEEQAGGRLRAAKEEQARLEAAAKEADLLRQRVQHLEDRLRSAGGTGEQLAAANAEIARLDAKLREAQSLAATARAAADGHAAQVAELATERDALAADRARRQDDQRRIDELQRLLVEAQQAAEARVGETREALVREMMAKDAVVGNLEAERTALRAEADRFRESAEEKDRTIQRLETDRPAMAETERHRLRTAELEETLRSKEEHLRLLTKQWQVAEGMLQETRRETERLRAAAAAATAAAGPAPMLIQERDELRAQLETERKGAAAMGAEVHAARSEVEALRAALESERTRDQPEVQAAAKEALALRGRIDEVSLHLRRKEEALANLTGEIRRLADVLREKDDSIRRKEMEIWELRRDVDDRTAALRRSPSLPGIGLAATGAQAPAPPAVAERDGTPHREAPPESTGPPSPGPPVVAAGGRPLPAAPEPREVIPEMRALYADARERQRRNLVGSYVHLKGGVPAAQAAAAVARAAAASASDPAPAPTIPAAPRRQAAQRRAGRLDPDLPVDRDGSHFASLSPAWLDGGERRPAEAPDEHPLVYRCTCGHTTELRARWPPRFLQCAHCGARLA